MSIIRASLLSLLVVAPLALTSPVMAKPNNGGFQKNAAAHKQFCADLKTFLDVAEGEADKRAGTKAAEPYAKEADGWWDTAHKQGCSWAQ